MPAGGAAIAIVTATIGTTLAPWGLSFIQSYVVDKKLRTADLGLERVDVVTGALLTGVIGLFVVVACAATLHRSGRRIVTRPTLRWRWNLSPGALHRPCSPSA
jgi:Mn2+/Fe2+ NRAMP family transporter